MGQEPTNTLGGIMNQNSRLAAVGRKAYCTPLTEEYFIKTERAFLQLTSYSRQNENTEEEELFI